MKYRWAALPLALSLAAAASFAGGCAAFGEKENGEDSLIVFNYGDYIEEEAIGMFEEETGIPVKYEQYVTPEDMYTKYQSGAIDYDVICTSDYMVEKMIRNGELQELDTGSMEHYGNLDLSCLGFCEAFDPGNRYAVPYFWGTVGILYNTRMVDGEVVSWETLWDEKYKGTVIMPNSIRDAFQVALKLEGHSLNTTDIGQMKAAQKLLFGQKELVMAYLVDESRDAMISGDASMAVIYSGDATVAMESNEDLDYCVPEEGSNIWFDCWAIPKTARHKEAAERFIDFMDREDIGRMNFDYINYATPNQAVYDSLDAETQADHTIFPSADVLEKCEVYQYLGEETERTYNQLWKELKSY